MIGVDREEGWHHRAIASQVATRCARRARAAPALARNWVYPHVSGSGLSPTDTLTHWAISPSFPGMPHVLDWGANRYGRQRGSDSVNG